MLKGADTYEGNTRNAFWMSDHKMELEKPYMQKSMEMYL